MAMRQTTRERSVVARYAPSPTGRLHLGNLRTALIAWLQCRLAGGYFILRIDDLDQPRNRPGAIEQIMEDLKWLGLNWDEGPNKPGKNGRCLQSERGKLYEHAFQQLAGKDFLYPCRCSRKDIALALSAPHHNDHRSIYPGTCRPPKGTPPLSIGIPNSAWRYRVGEIAIRFNDVVMGPQEQRLDTEVGDFVIKRRDGLFAYQLASVVDDGLMGVTDIVRGGDLIGSAARQIALFQSLGYDAPTFWHIPLMTDDTGTPLSKRDQSESLTHWQDRGYRDADLIAKLAFSAGLIDKETPIGAQQLLRDLTPEKLKTRLVRQQDKPNEHFYDQR